MSQHRRKGEAASPRCAEGPFSVSSVAPELGACCRETAGSGNSSSPRGSWPGTSRLPQAASSPLALSGSWLSRSPPAPGGAKSCRMGTVPAHASHQASAHPSASQQSPLPRAPFPQAGERGALGGVSWWKPPPPRRWVSQSLEYKCALTLSTGIISHPGPWGGGVFLQLWGRTQASGGWPSPGMDFAPQELNGGREDAPRHPGCHQGPERCQHTDPVRTSPLSRLCVGINR